MSSILSSQGRQGNLSVAGGHRCIRDGSSRLCILCHYVDNCKAKGASRSANAPDCSRRHRSRPLLAPRHPYKRGPVLGCSKCYQASLERLWRAPRILPITQVCNSQMG